jgi:hypothetical protein
MDTTALGFSNSALLRRLASPLKAVPSGLLKLFDNAHHLIAGISDHPKSEKSLIAE